MELILEKGAETLTQCDYNEAMRAAARRGHKEIVQIMLEKGAATYDQVMLPAWKSGHYNISRMIREWKNKQTINKQ